MSRIFLLVFITVFTLPSLLETSILDKNVEAEIVDHINKMDATKSEQQSGHFEGDIVMDPREQEALTSGKLMERDAVIIPRYLWSDGILYYSLHSSLSEYTRKMIHKAFSHIELHTCIRFHEHNGEPNQHYVEYFAGNGCYSRIGRYPFDSPSHYKQVISIGRGCERLGTIVHESMHALGFFHEHTRPDRDKYVRIVWDQIKKGHENNFRIYPRKKGKISSLSKPYDYLSVMHYSRYAFAKDDHQTIIPTKPKAIIGQRFGLSLLDAYEINKLYCAGVKCRDRAHPFVCRYFKRKKYHGLCPTIKMRIYCKRTCRLCRHPIYYKSRHSYMFNTLKR